MNGTFIRNLETGKVELHFAKADYMALTDAQKGTIKSACLFSGRSGCWVSRATRSDYRAVQVATALGLTDEGETGERLSFAQQQDRIVERATERAERMQTHAENAEHRAAQAFDRADLREEKSGIPLGQPILVGHHSERRHRRAIERADNAMRKACEETDKAKYFEGRAAAAVYTASRDQMQDKTYLQNRIDENAAQVRRLSAALEKSRSSKWLAEYAGLSYMPEYPKTEEAFPEYKARCIARSEERLTEWNEKLDYFQAALDALGGVTYSKANVKPGDMIKIRGRWEQVVKANGKTVASSSGFMPWPLKHVWAEVQEHKPATVEPVMV